MAKSDTRVCRYINCLHENKTINLVTDEFEKDGSSYFHKDCYKTRANIQRIKTLWHDNIDSMVVYAQLNKIVNQLIFNDHISSDYILFAVKYAIDHKDEIKLRYPPGLRYVIGNQRVKDAYKKSTMKRTSQSDFVAHDDDSTSPKFSFNSKPMGFGNILGGGQS